MVQTIISFDLHSRHMRASNNPWGLFAPSHLKVWYKRLVKHTQGISEQVREVESRVLTEIESTLVIKVSHTKDQVENVSEMNISTTKG